MYCDCDWCARNKRLCRDRWEHSEVTVGGSGGSPPSAGPGGRQGRPTEEVKHLFGLRLGPVMCIFVGLGNYCCLPKLHVLAGM